MAGDDKPFSVMELLPLLRSALNTDNELVRTVGLRLLRSGAARTGRADVAGLVEFLGTPGATRKPAAPGAPSRQPAAALPAGVLAARPIAAGRADGTARVVADLAQAANAAPGDVLVCPTVAGAAGALPAGVAALIVETGGMGSAAIRACRERGIPAVQLARACDLVADGGRVRVDGTAGLVTPG